MRMIRRIRVVVSGALLVLGAVMLSAVPTGAAADVGVGVLTQATAVPATDGGDVTVLAWECPSGDFCVWENLNGTGRRCNWGVADPDWRNGSAICSWAATVKVESAKDNGNDSRFVAVAAYRLANYQDLFGCFDRGKNYNITNGGVILRSHKWVTSHC